MGIYLSRISSSFCSIISCSVFFSPGFCNFIMVFFLNENIVQLASADQLVKSSTYEESTGRFTIPPRTTCVFVEPRKTWRLFDLRQVLFFYMFDDKCRNLALTSQVFHEFRFSVFLEEAIVASTATAFMKLVFLSSSGLFFKKWISRPNSFSSTHLQLSSKIKLE